LQQDLAVSQKAFADLQEMRSKEMQTVAVVCTALTDRIRALNINFEEMDDDEGSGEGASPSKRVKPL
jgi:hypothetical protein